MASLLFTADFPRAAPALPGALHGAGWEVVVADRLAEARHALGGGGYARLVATAPPDGFGPEAASQLSLHLVRGDVPLAAILSGVGAERCGIVLDGELAVGLYCRNWPEDEYRRGLFRLLQGPRLRERVAGPLRRLQFAADGEGPGRICLASLHEGSLLDPDCLALVKSPLAAMRRCAAIAMRGAGQGLRRGSPADTAIPPARAGGRGAQADRRVHVMIER